MADFFGDDFGIYDQGGYDFGEMDWNFDLDASNWWDGFQFDDWGSGGDYSSNFTFDSIDPSQYGVQLAAPSTGWNGFGPGGGSTPSLDRESFAPPNLASNANPTALTASMPLHAYDDWGGGSNYRSDFTLDTVNPSQYGSQLPSGSSWGDKLNGMADRIVGQLPKMALSALVGKPKLPGGGAMDTLNASVARSNAFNDRLMSDYTTNMPGVQQTALQTLAQTTPQGQANEAYRGAMVSDAAGRRALERRMSAGSMSPDARMAAMARYDVGAGANRAQAYNTGLGRGLSQTMGAATQAAGLFPQPNYGATGALAASAAGMAANRGMQEFNMRQQQLSDISGLLDGYEEGRTRGTRRQSYL